MRAWLMNFLAGLFQPKPSELRFADKPMVDTWRCGVCHDERPDEFISVLTYPIKDFPGAECNLKYCNDRPECYAGVVEASKKGEVKS